MDPLNTQDSQPTDQPLGQQPAQSFPASPQPDAGTQPYADPTVAMPQPPAQDLSSQPAYQPDVPSAAPAPAFQPIAPQTYSPEPQPMAPAPANPIMPGMQPSDFNNPMPQSGVTPGPQAFPDTSAQMPMASLSAGAGSGKKKAIIIALVIVVVLALAGFAVAALSSKKTSTDSNKSDSTAEPLTGKDTPEPNEVTATSLSDFDNLCQGNVVSNAAAPGSVKPRPIALFEQSDVSKDQFNTSPVYIKDASWKTDSTTFANTQLVGCFSRKSETATGKKCDFKSGDTPISIEQYSVIYNLVIYEAKTGKVLGTKEVSGPVGSCPFLASYNKEDPKLYADPDEGGTIEAVRPFVTQ